ncbi:hypothetical protein [Desulfococcus multivorans]|uniref:Uncharacterized protein n=1 Tax=Desulfococcus multivorans DSM 2059 TaxID=1121405 RepID=S7UPM3_DESML|nr:hypothetical protein [Desulfococcus multivorans]AOY59982.1 uncharacterized protein Dmul_32120 [Desulfococcus multivorans]AQV02128.1 hypothetical protein B2D07_16080 [Desulfococcus multivorans]EPR35979.1 hypothetical protein dsmv_0684 [Desulfococcus multivorans DSM 2059]SJZ36147.1 hypothetical protein SAMN02745446_00202 [Desulfococcus multivorans DSM 2059]
MSFFGYPDLDRPIPFEDGMIYYPFGGGPFALTPNRCSVAEQADDRVGFSLDLYRPALTLPGTQGYALLEMRLNAQYATDKALNRIRSRHPNATLSNCALTDWYFRLVPGALGLNLPPELLAPVQLAANNLGSARLVIRLSLEGGLILKEILCNSLQPVYAVAEARMQGISPRVDAVVRFRAQELLPAIAAAAGGRLSRQTLVNFFTQDPAGLPAEITGRTDLIQTPAFREAMVDRIIARFGTYLPAAEDLNDPDIQLQAPDDGDRDIFWSLSQPFPASRSVVMQFDALSGVRRRLQALGSEVFIHQHTAAALTELEQSHLMIFCNLPIQRIGVAAIGANLTFPPNPPDRPQSRQITVTLEPPDDLVQTQVRLSPGESLQYRYNTFAVIADDLGVREVHGPTLSGSGSPLRLFPNQFPIEFATIEATPELLGLAALTGTCGYRYGGQEHSLPFSLDDGRPSISLSLPQGSEAVSLTCTAADRFTGKQLRLRPFESWPVLLDLVTFPEYGYHEVEITCRFDRGERLYAIEVLPVLAGETFDNMTTLVFTPDQPSRRYGWFAPSPFHPEFRYRPYAAGGPPEAWQTVPYPVERLTIQPRQPETRPVREMPVLSERMTPRPERIPLQPHSEAAEAGVRQWPKGVPICPQPEPTDTLLYSLPGDPSVKLYIPRYSLDILSVSGQQRYRIAMADHGGVASLTVGLVKGLAPAIQDAGRDAQEYPHEIAVSLDFLPQPPSGARKTLSFQEVTVQGAVITAKLTFATLQERDNVFQALTQTDRQARLIVKRVIEVALPRTAPPKTDFNDIRVKKVTAGLPPRPLTATLQPNLLNAGMRVPAGRITPINTPDPLNIAVVVRPVNTRHSTDTRRPVNTLTAVDTSLLGNVERHPNRIHLRTSEASRLSGLQPDLTNRVTGRLTRFPPTFPPIINRGLPVPVLAFLGKETITVGGTAFVQVNLSVTNWQDYANDDFKPSPDLPPCGKNTNASRTWVDIYDAAANRRLYGFCALSSPRTLTRLWFRVPAGKLPKQVYVQLEDRRTKVVRKSDPVETRSAKPQPPQYLEAVRELDQTVQPAPFTFPYNLHGYIFQGIVPGTDAGSGLIRYRLQSQGKFHTYLQDSANPKMVYYFPDEFKIARRQEAPFTPFITVRVASRTGTQDTDVLFDYIVAPYTHLQRLDEARPALLAEPRFGAATVEFQPFLTSDVRFFIDRPTERGSVQEERTGVSLVLQDLIKDSLVMKLPDFRVLFDALQRDTASLFLGRMEIEVPGENKEVIPFTARLDDLVGELFLYGVEAGSDAGYNVSLLNAIESPLQIDALNVSLHLNGQTLPAITQGLTFPIRNLASGAKVDFKVVPQFPIPGSHPPEIRISLQDVQVLPDAAAVWDSILDRTTLEYFNTITVKAIPTLFTPVAGREDEQISVILVEFQGGGTAELTASRLEAQVRIDYPIDDVILRRGLDETYSYTVTVIRVNGRQDRDPEPRRQSAQLFYVSVLK